MGRAEETRLLLEIAAARASIYQSTLAKYFIFVKYHALTRVIK